MTEREESEVLARRFLDEPNCDPDDELRMLSRQLLRRNEQVVRLLKIIGNAYTSLSQHSRFEVPPIVVRDIARSLQNTFHAEAAGLVIPQT